MESRIYLQERSELRKISRLGQIWKGRYMRTAPRLATRKMPVIQMVFFIALRVRPK